MGKETIGNQVNPLPEKKKMAKKRVYMYPRGMALTKTNLNSRVPPHLRTADWLEFEYQTLLPIWKSLVAELYDLKDKTSPKRVHDSRVMMRRLFSVWDVLDKDNWSSAKFERKAGKSLRRLLKELGALRDWDVNLEVLQEYGSTTLTLEKWQAKRDKCKEKVKKQISKIDLEALDKWYRTYLTKRLMKLKKAAASRHKHSAYTHIDGFLSAQEAKVKADEPKAKTTEELHALRLEIKRWRYLLTEFFGLTNIELQRAQQLLGRINDFTRVADELSRGKEKKLVAKLEAKQGELLQQFGKLRKQLCYGLRPSLTSFPG